MRRRGTRHDWLMTSAWLAWPDPACPITLMLRTRLKTHGAGRSVIEMGDLREKCASCSTASRVWCPSVPLRFPPPPVTKRSAERLLGVTDRDEATGVSPLPCFSEWINFSVSFCLVFGQICAENANRPEMRLAPPAAASTPHVSHVPK
jgi:hypothetical protein